MADGPQPLPRSIATRTGDDGTTSLLYGQRVSKDHPQIETVGTLDELNAALGLAKASRPTGRSADELERIQRELPDLRVVKSLNTLTASLMVHPETLPEPTTVFVSGDDADAKATVVGLLFFVLAAWMLGIAVARSR